MISKDYFDLEITPDECLKASCNHLKNGESTFLDDDSDYVKCSICGCKIKKEHHIKTIQERDEDLDIIQKLRDCKRIDFRDFIDFIDKEYF